GLIFEIWMGCFYHTSNTVNLVSATKYTAFGVMEYCIFVKDLVDCSATTHGVVFAKYVAQITKQQGRYAVGHGLSPLGNRASLSRCKPQLRGDAVGQLAFSFVNWFEVEISQIHVAVRQYVNRERFSLCSDGL